MFGDDDEMRQSMSLLGLAMTLFIVVSCLVLVRKLQVRTMLETCERSPQTGCMVKIDRLRVSRHMFGL
jgi:hypothetical protein